MKNKMRQKLNYSADNWAHQALLMMDEVDALVCWASVNHPQPEKYEAAAKAFWKVCDMLAIERNKLHIAQHREREVGM